ncbi:hypothetical protein [Halobacillus salinus]|nr:hypothetical protein [Halobacillus salinus]
MTASAVIMMVLGMMLAWGSPIGGVLLVVHVMRRKRDEYSG